MYNPYFSSTIYAVKCRESFTLSSNGYSNLWYERFDRNPSHCSSCCSCCDCCALSTYRVPLKTSILTGLRQSTLLQLPASRRLILGGGDVYFSRLPSYDLHRGCCELNFSVNERTVYSRSRRRVEGRRMSAPSQKGREICHSFDSDDVESVLSLLSEEGDKDDSSIKLKNASSSKRMEAQKKRQTVVSKERNLSLSKKAEAEKKGKLKNNVTTTIDLRREDENVKKEREVLTRSENQRKRRDVSSSSFYSLSSGDFASDLELQDNHDLEELSITYEKDAANHEERKVEDELDMQTDVSQKLHGVSNQERTTFGADIDWSLRKKSEKKLADVSMEETVSTKEYQDKHSRAFITHESSYGKASSSYKQLEREEDDSSIVKDLNKKTQKTYIQTGNIRKHQSTDTQVSDYDEVDSTLTSQKTFSGREGNLEISETLLKERSDEHKTFVGSSSATGKETSKSKKTFGAREDNLEISETHLHGTHDEREKFVGSASTTGKDVINRNSQKYMGKYLAESTERTSNSRVQNIGEKKVSILRQEVQGVDEQHQKGVKIVTQAKERRSSQQFSEVSRIHESNVEDTSIVKSRTRIKDWEENSNLSSDARGTWLQTDKSSNQSIQHRKGSEHVSTLSEGHASDEKQFSSTQRISGNLRIIPKSKSTSVVKTRESSCQTDERIVNFELASEDQRPRNQSVTEGTVSREKSSFQGSLNLISGAGKRVILEEGGERTSAVIPLPSSSRLMGRDAVLVDLAAGIASPEIIIESSDSGSSALYDNSGRSPNLLSGSYSTDEIDQAFSEPSNILALEGALGSADLSEKSSEHFVERVGPTSETQEVEFNGTRLAIEDEENKVYSSRQQGTQNDSQSKEHGSSHSSGFPGTKGPSDEMWDVNEPSVEQSLVAAEPVVSKETEITIVNRTGRSLWSVIGDVVRLRWGSRAGSTTPAGRSGDRNSSNKSDSETWFSGQDQEEASKSNVIRETSVQPQIMTSDKSKSSTPYTQSEGEVSDAKNLKDKGKHVELGSSSPHTLVSGSTSVGASYASGEENANWSEDGKDLKVTTSGITNVEIPVPLPASGPPVVGEIIVGSDMSGIKPMVLTKEPDAPLQSELSGSGKKDGELQQRKFQRTKQVLRDRFDDWEEAYKLEFEQRRMDEMFMKEALVEAKKAADIWEVPVGAVLVQHGKIIARGCNLVEELRDSTAHAEMICIREASSLLRTWRLSDTTLYVTLEPCPMCSGAILQARVDTVVWGAPNKLLGADGSWIRLFPDGGESASEPRDIPPAPVHPFHPKIKIRRGVLAAECADAMQQFFQLRRKKKQESSDDPSSLPVTPHHPSKFLNKIHDIFHVFCL